MRGGPGADAIVQAHRDHSRRADADHRYDEFATYTNSVLANGIALVPQYSNSTRNANALAAYRSAGYQAVGIDSRLIIRYSGATHCLSMQIPR